MLDGTERNPPDPTYTCAVRMERGVYKLKEEHEEGGSEQKKKREKDINRKEESKSRGKELH